MAMKRKFDVDSEDSRPVTKQLKLVPFPNMEMVTDVPMSDVESMYPDVVHSRLHSNASSLSSNASDSPSSDSPSYPAFNLYPLTTYSDDMMVDHKADTYSCQSAPTTQVGLFQPSGSFMHHGSNCTQIPKLRIACAASGNGQRTMWSHCEQCGAISMVESD